jgi:predicted aldo/keto reductase-like oxidoreductase
MGKALEGRRDQAFLMTKHHGRDSKAAALEQLEESLRRLGTDHVDLWQFHEIIYPDDPQRIFSSDAIEAADQAKRQGKTRYIGFTGHKTPVLHLQMLAYGYDWDAVQMPINPFDAHYSSFQKWVLPVLTERGIAPLAMKTRGGGQLLKAAGVSAEDLWRYAIAQPVCTVVSGMESMNLLRKNLEMARTLEPMTKEEQQQLEKQVAQPAADGAWEKYKTTNRFDGWKGREVHEGKPPAVENPVG